MSTWIIGVLLAGLCAPAHGAFDDLGAGARGPGLGDAFVAIADDVYALHYNPAGLAVIDRPQFGTSYSKLHLGLTDRSNLSTSFAGYAQPVRGGRQGVVGASWNSFALGELYREQAFGLSYGRAVGRPERGLHAGGTLKYLQSGLGDLPEAGNAYSGIGLTGRADPVLARRTQSAIDADLGLLWRLGRSYALGIDVMHFLQPNVAFQSGATDKLPITFKAGFAYRSSLSNLVAQMDTAPSPNGDTDLRFTAGAERWFPRLFVGEFGVRGALSIGTRERREVATGLSYRARRFGVDYGFAIPIGGLDATAGTHRVAVNFRFGAASEEDESIEMVLEAMRQLKRGEAAPRLKVEGTGLSIDQKTTVEEYLAQMRGLEQRAQYREALEKLSLALFLAPAEKIMLAEYGKLNYIAQQIPALNDYKTDPLQASMHQGLLAYLAGKDKLAVARLAQALALKPDYRELEVFLAGLEKITGEKRPPEAPSQRPRNWRLAAQLTKADTAIQEGRYREGVELALEVLREEDNNSVAWQDLGTAYFALKDYPRSLASWRRALELESDAAVKGDIRGYIRSVEKAMKYDAQRKAAAASAATAAAAPPPPPPPARPRLDPQQVQGLFDRAVDQYTRRQLPEAKRLLEQILESEPDNAEARKALRRVEEELK